MTDLSEILLVKLGGSLITDKTRPETPRLEVIRRLADEVREVTAERSLPLIIGHGSGSFGHVAASESGIHEGVSDPAQVPGVSTTQAQAFKLHQIVVSALRDAGVAAYSVVPSSCMLASAGQPDQVWPEPSVGGPRPGPGAGGLWRCGDGSGMGSLHLFDRVALSGAGSALGSRGVFVRRVVWLGATDGVLDAGGATIPEIPVAELVATTEGFDGAAGTDVTGGIRLRLQTVGALAHQGIASWIGDGRRPRALVEGLEDTAEHGTRILPGR